MQHGVKSKITPSNQCDLIHQLKQIFAGDFSQENARKTTSLTDPDSGNYRELDVWIPKYNISFEFQDSYHYVTTWYNQLSKDAIHHNDSTKQGLALKNGTTLVVIPCWWDGSIESLLATIYFQRPDLWFPGFYASVPVALNPPLGYFVDLELPGVGELMVATFLKDNNSLLNPSFSHESWWIGEKYDGIRFCWNSKRRKLYTRQGRVLEVLPNLEKALPALFLDGEIWFGRGQFNDTNVLTLGSVDCVLWDYLRMIAFDVPSLDSHNAKFELRYKRLVKETQAEHSCLILAPRILNKNYQQVLNTVAQILADGGEGVIMRKIGSFYVNGKSDMLLKIKAAQGDREAIVLGVLEDTSVELQLPEGTTFVVAADDVMIPTPRVGDVVSFSFEAQARREAPVAPTIFRVRSDVSWEDVVACAARENLGGFSEKPLGHWTVKQIRQLLQDYATNRKLDPLLPDSWYNVPVTDIHQLQGGTTILRKIKGGLVGVLQQAFPEVDFDHSQFAFPRYLWTDIRNRRHFFEHFARENGFDPLVADNWHFSQIRDKMMAQKAIKGVLWYHNGTLSTALIDLFPDVVLDRSKLFSKGLWDEPENRRKFFEDYAIQNGFDPLSVPGWNTQTRERIMRTEGARSVIGFHENSVSTALRDLFPEVNFAAVNPLTQNVWSDRENRRKFFENYAKANRFDPYDPECWYSQKRENIMASEGAHKVMRYYSDRVSTALTSLFPNIGFQKHKFRNYAKGFERRRIVHKV